MPRLRQELCADALISGLRSSFSRIRDARKNPTIPLDQILMSAYAVFSLKYPSLLAFEKDQRMSETEVHNMETLYGVSQIPSDTQMRQVIDNLSPDDFGPSFKDLFTRLQRGKVLDEYKFIDDHYLVSIDGTGLFSSNEISCDCCMEKVSRKDGTRTFYHQMLGLVLIHPDKKEVIPLCPEAITKQDGSSKNDCERNAAKRAIAKLRKDHPKLKVIVVEDGLSSNAPHIRTLISHQLSFILGAKPSDHKYLFEMANLSGAGQTSFEYVDESGYIHRFKYVNDLPLNESNEHLRINLLEYEEVNNKTGKVLNFSWVTNIDLTVDNIRKIMRAGRARWRIENETFNTLKNQGYNFEHNYGHGEKNLCTNFAMLMFLAFSVDQIQQLCCKAFQQARQASGAFYQFCQRVLSAFMHFTIPNWSALLAYVAQPIRVPIPTGPPA